MEDGEEEVEYTSVVLAVLHRGEITMAQVEHTYYDPLLGSGNGAWVMPSNMYNNFNLNNAILSPGPDRTALNENLENTLWSIGLVTNISSWSIDKAVALAHTAGLVMKEYFPMAVVAGRYKGVAGVGMSGYTMYVGLSYGNSFDEDGWNIR